MGHKAAVTQEMDKNMAYFHDEDGSRPEQGELGCRTTLPTTARYSPLPSSHLDYQATLSTSDADRNPESRPKRDVDREREPHPVLSLSA
jgi:hypothetical protein